MKVGSFTRLHHLLFAIPGYDRFMKTYQDICQFDASRVAQYRKEVLDFFSEFGLRATKSAFKVSKTSIYRWRKKLLDNQGRLTALIPQSTKPKSPRRMMTDLSIIEFIRCLRKKHHKLGKEKIKPLLDKYSVSLGITSISESTIGKIIKRHKFFYQKQGRIYHNPGCGWSQRKKVKRLRVRYAPKPQDFGHLQMDTVLRLIDGIKIYFYSVIDIRLKFSLSLPYQKLNSFNALDFFKKVELVYPLAIRSVQTDNGLEFLGVFDHYLKKKNIPHFFIYPRCPRINGVIERYQRTLQEDFIDQNLHLVHKPELLNDKLIQFLLFYNLERPHKSLGLKSPMEYLVFKGLESQKMVTYTQA